MPNALNRGPDPRGEMRAPARNQLMGWLADKLGQANAFATKMDPRYENKRENQTLGSWFSLTDEL